MREKLFNNKNAIFCFSPLAMVVTLVIELGLAIFVLARNTKNIFNRVTAFTLLLLGLFQIAEYAICMLPSLGMFWAKIGMVAITLLPPTGIYLISLISNKSKFLKVSYLLATGFCVYFVFVPNSVALPVCGGNYIVLDIGSTFYYIYSVYYFGFLLLGIWIAWINSRTADSKVKQTLMWAITAYLSFVLPTAVVYLLYPVSPHAIASIMCGFAILMAIILTFRVLPLYHKVKRNN